MIHYEMILFSRSIPKSESRDADAADEMQSTASCTPAVALSSMSKARRRGTLLVHMKNQQLVQKSGAIPLMRKTGLLVTFSTHGSDGGSWNPLAGNELLSSFSSLELPCS